jgi:hypothetical protein
MAKPVDDTGWQQIIPTAGDGDRAAAGRVEMVRGSEVRPCLMCKSWERDERRLIQHLMALGLEVQPDGRFKTPIAKDIPGRKSLILDPKKTGFCRYEGTVTEDLATCQNWTPVRFASELKSRL